MGRFYHRLLVYDYVLSFYNAGHEFREISYTLGIFFVAEVRYIHPLQTLPIRGLFYMESFFGTLVDIGQN